jgi:D-xylose transport system substrate-binding protein
MKKWWNVIVAAILCLTLTACGTREEESTVRDSKEDKIQIGMCFDSFVIERWQRDRDIFVSVAKELGAEVNVQNAGGDVEQQKDQIDYFIKKKMDVIVIISTDVDALAKSVEKAHEAGIKVISYDRLIQGTDVDLYITFDNEKVGSLMGQALIDQGLAGGRVLMLGGSPTDSNVPQVEAGFRQVMEENEVIILDSVHAESWRAELAAEYVYDHPSVVEETDAIMCGNDDLATQVVRALSETRQAGDVLVVGQDADLAACQRIVEGTQLMTVYKSVEKLATRAAEEAVALAKGEEISGDDVTMIRNGDYEIPCISFEPVAVTKDNMDQVIIDSGFHLKEDVYLNVSD